MKRSFSSQINSNNCIINNLQKSYDVDSNCLLNIKAQVIDSQLVHGPGKTGDYVVYFIEIVTDYKKWIIKKRYSEFYELNQKLILKVPELNKLFPPKRLFKNSEETIEERKTCFNKYLQFLFQKKNIFSLNEVLDFIQFEKKIIELYIKKHTMIRQDEDNYVFQSLKKTFSIMSFLEKMQKSKSVGESLNTNGIESLSTNSNTKEEIYKINEEDYKVINSIIMESSDATYEIEEELSNSNYYSSLLEYEKSKNTKDTKENKEDEINNFTNNYINEGGDVVITEFLKNLSQDIDNKTEILSTFEDFLKKGQKWPYFSESDIIKLYVGNSNYISNSKKNDVKTKSNKKENGEQLLLYKRYPRKISSNFEQNQKLKLNEILDDDDSDENISIKGIFYYIGDFDNNILLSMGCLELLTKLLDFEFNPEYDLYLRLFKNRRISDYQSMKLEEIIKNNKGGVKSTKNAFKLLSILTEGRNKEIIEKSLIKDEAIINQLNIYNIYS
jgi:hypothetical protein